MAEYMTKDRQKYKLKQNHKNHNRKTKWFPSVNDRNPTIKL